MPTNPGSPLDRALDELYAATPPEFVLVRSRLERELRATDETAAATEIRGRRRPHLAAWAANQLARAEPDGVGELLTLTQQVGEAQQAVIDGADADTLRERSRDRRDVLERLTTMALATLSPWAPKPATYRDPVLATLDAASLDPDLAVDLRAGRLTRALSAPAGLGPLPDPNPPPPSSRAPGRPSKREVDKAERELAQARREAQELAIAADTAATEQASAEMHADATTAQLREVERAIERARGTARQATNAAHAARERTTEARRLADRAEQRLRRAEQRLRDLTSS
ncbi:MAG TPA: hypothetical protein VLV81_03880 [Acidimicrobiia bacterium]|nr:hypothetical protein [Acidimicrobiia bacterium]